MSTKIRQAMLELAETYGLTDDLGEHRQDGQNVYLCEDGSVFEGSATISDEEWKQFFIDTGLMPQYLSEIGASADCLTIDEYGSSQKMVCNSPINS